MNNHPALRSGLFLAAVAAVAAVSCWLTGRFFEHGRPVAEAAGAHEWIHRELVVTPEQDRALEATERRYAQRRRELSETIREANRELARAVLEDRAYSPRATAAIEKIHHAQGELQKATLEHVFEMRPALTAEQYDKLLRSTAEALQSQPD